MTDRKQYIGVFVLSAALSSFSICAAPALLAQEPLPQAPGAMLLPASSVSASQQGLPAGQSLQPADDTPPPVADGGSLWKRKYLFGDWNGARAKWEQRGFTLDAYYTDDALGNARGGRSDFAAWGRIRTSLDVDFSKFTSDKDLTLHVTGLWQYGVDLSKQYTYTLLDSSSLPSAHTVRMDSWFFQQYLLHHHLAVRGGQIAAYDTYGDAEYGASFINLAMGYAHSNLNQAVYFAFNPAGVPSFEVKVLPTDHVYVKAMVQSEERDPYTQDPSGLNFHLGGPVMATEIGYLKDPPKTPDATYTMGPEPFITSSETGNYPGVYKFGAGYDPHNFTDLRTGAPKPGNYLLYAQVDQAVYRMGKVGQDSKRGLDVTYSEDYSPGDVTEQSHQLWAGARWIGPAGGRWAKDTIALGYVRTETGSHYRENSIALGGPSLGAEHLVELNYMTQPTPWLLLQPVVQWFVNPGGDANRQAVIVAGWRTKITF